MGNGSGFAMQLVILAVFIVAMYFLLIRPQKKKEKQISEMRNSLQVGDEVITIGGICGKIVKTKDDSIVIQVGADKVKFEMMRWAISSVVSSSKSAKPSVADEEEKKIMPKRLKKADVYKRQAVECANSYKDHRLIEITSKKSPHGLEMGMKDSEIREMLFKDIIAFYQKNLV